MPEFYSQACQDKFIVNILSGKRNGKFLEIGSNDPIHTNNTYLLETTYGWSGVMVEYNDTFLDAYRQHRPRSVYALTDATRVDYASIFQQTNMPAEMDYLQIDLDVDNRSTLTTLELLDTTLFDQHKFATVTFEHDVYMGNYYDTRNASRQIFANRGYVRVFSDVCDHRREIVFEDWYVHPDLVDMDHVNRIMEENQGKYMENGLTGTSILCQDIVYPNEI